MNGAVGPAPDAGQRSQANDAGRGGQGSLAVPRSLMLADALRRTSRRRPRCRRARAPARRPRTRAARRGGRPARRRAPPHGRVQDAAWHGGTPNGAWTPTTPSRRRRVTAGVPWARPRCGCACGAWRRGRRRPWPTCSPPVWPTCRTPLARMPSGRSGGPGGTPGCPAVRRPWCGPRRSPGPPSCSRHSIGGGSPASPSSAGATTGGSLPVDVNSCCRAGPTCGSCRVAAWRSSSCRPGAARRTGGWSSATPDWWPRSCRDVTAAPCRVVGVWPDSGQVRVLPLDLGALRHVATAVVSAVATWVDSRIEVRHLAEVRSSA